MMSRSAVMCVLLGVLLTACGDGGDGPEPTAGARPTASADDAALQPAWTATPRERPFVARAPNEGPSAVATVDTVVTVGRTSVTAHGLTGGDERWSTPVGGVVCATSSQPGGTAGAEVFVLLTGPRPDVCTQAVALDISTGSVLWRSRLPAPRQNDDPFGYEVATGTTTATVAIGCIGVTRLSLADGADLSVLRSDATDVGACTTAATDGSTTAVATGSDVVVYDDATGARTSVVDVPGIGRVGDVVSADPLIVTALLDSGAGLLDLTAAAPEPFGRSVGGYGGEVAAHTRVDDMLWTLDAEASELVGYDLETQLEVAQVNATGATEWVASRDGRIIMVLDDDRGEGPAQITEVDPTTGDPSVVATLPARRAGHGALRDQLVAGDLLIRVRDSRLETFSLP